MEDHQMGLGVAPKEAPLRRPIVRRPVLPHAGVEGQFSKAGQKRGPGPVGLLPGPPKAGLVPSGSFE